MTPFSRTETQPNTQTLYWNYPPGTPPSVTVQPHVKFDRSLSCAPLVKGNHRSPNNWSFAYACRTRSGGRVHSYTRNYGTINEGPDLGPAVGTPSSYTSTSNVYNKALGKLYDNIRGNVDLSIDLAEIGKTTSMIRNASTELVRLATSWRRGLLSGGKQAANVYLQYHYGVQPLMKTIHELSTRQLTCAVQPVTYQSRASATERWRKSARGWYDPNIHSTVDVELTNRCLLGLTFQQSSSGISTLAQFTSLNPISIVWELTPYSFVVDWVIDVGGYLRMAETALLSGLQFIGGFRTNSSKGFSRIENSGTWVEYGTTTIHNTKGSYETKSMNRAVLSSMPFPELPRIDVNMGSSRLLSTAALLSQRLRHS